MAHVFGTAKEEEPWIWHRASGLAGGTAHERAACAPCALLHAAICHLPSRVHQLPRVIDPDLPVPGRARRDAQNTGQSFVEFGSPAGAPFLAAHDVFLMLLTVAHAAHTTSPYRSHPQRGSSFEGVCRCSLPAGPATRPCCFHCLSSNGDGFIGP